MVRRLRHEEGCLAGLARRLVDAGADGDAAARGGGRGPGAVLGELERLLALVLEMNPSL